jgi:hypothetical protein
MWVSVRHISVAKHRVLKINIKKLEELPYALKHIWPAEHIHK